jgi:hypothetical protein
MPVAVDGAACDVPRLLAELAANPRAKANHVVPLLAALKSSREEVRSPPPRAWGLSPC